MTWATDLFGPALVVKEDDKAVEKPTDDVLAGKKFVVLYFSAHVSAARPAAPQSRMKLLRVRLYSAVR